MVLASFIHHCRPPLYHCKCHYSSLPTTQLMTQSDNAVSPHSSARYCHPSARPGPTLPLPHYPISGFESGPHGSRHVCPTPGLMPYSPPVDSHLRFYHATWAQDYSRGIAAVGDTARLPRVQQRVSSPHVATGGWHQLAVAWDDWRCGKRLRRLKPRSAMRGWIHLMGGVHRHRSEHRHVLTAATCKG